MFNRKEYQKKWREKNSEYQKQWQKENPEYLKKWRKANPEKVRKYNKKYRKENSEYSKKWRKENPEKVRKYAKTIQRGKRKQRRQLDPKFRLDCNMGSLISMALRGKKAGRKWESLVGYNLEDLRKYLEKQFDDKMNWGNYGSYWWVDHQKPRSLFKYNLAEDPEFKKCWALENLQPLEKIANIKKGNRF